MAVSTLPGIGFTLTIPDTTTLVRCDDIQFGADAVPTPGNCRTIIVFNMDAANRVFVKFAQVRQITMSSMTVLNSIVLPTLSSITFAVGYLGDRPDLAGNLEDCLFFKAETGVNVDVNVAYLQGRGTQLL